MSFVQTLAIAIAQLAAHKLRTTLTTLGMMFGVGAVIAMLSIGAGAEKKALVLIDRLGARNVLVRDNKLDPAKLSEARKKSLGVSPRDVDAIDEAIRGAQFLAPRSEIQAYGVVAGPFKTHAQLLGVTERYRDAVPVALSEGRFIDDDDDRHAAQVCVIGAGARRDLFGADRALGKDVKVDDLWCEVVGVLARDPAATAELEGVAVTSSDHLIYLPLTTTLAKLDRDPLKAPLAEIVVRLAADVPAADTAAMIGALLDRVHGGERDYQIVVPELLLEHSRQTRQLFNLVMGLIAGISLVVGGVGIVNVMLASVLEQTREIGLRRAVGARRADIHRQFLITAFTLALFGGLLGVATGLGIARGVAAYADWPTVVTLSSVALSLGVAIGVGLISGLFPALRAARLDPIQALAAA